MIVELCGMPGTGKTSVAKRLEQELGFTTIHITSTAELLIRNLLYTLQHPLRTINLFVACVQAAGPKSFWYKCTNLLLHPNAKYQKAAGYQKALIDQGHVQTAMSLFEAVLPPEKMRAFLHNTERPDILFLFTASQKTRMERLSGREYIVRTRDGEEAFLKRLDVLEQQFTRLLDETDLAKQMTTIVDSDGSKDKVYAAVATALTPHL